MPLTFVQNLGETMPAMAGNQDKTADHDGNAPPPRIEDMPFRRRLLPVITIATTLLMGHYLAWGVLDLLDPEFDQAFIALALPFVLVPAILFAFAARPRRKLYWAILGGATLVSAFLGTLGHYLSMRLIDPMKQQAMLGELPAILTGIVAAIGVATGVWLLFRRLTRAEGLWIGPMIDR